MRQATVIRAAAGAILLASGGALILSPLILFTSLFAFDAPGSERNPEAYLMLLTLWGIPLLLGLSLLMSIKALVRPTARSLAIAGALVALPAVAGEYLFDPLHLKPMKPTSPVRTCYDGAQVDRHGKSIAGARPDTPPRWICRDGNGRPYRATQPD